MLSEQAYNDLNPLVKEHCGLPSYWYSLSVDLQDFLQRFIIDKSSMEEKRVKDVFAEKLQYMIEEFQDQLEETEEEKVREMAEDFADNLEILLDEWTEKQ